MVILNLGYKYSIPLYQYVVQYSSLSVCRPANGFVNFARATCKKEKNIFDIYF